MLDAKKILEMAEAHLEGSELFVVDVKVSTSNEIELLIDSDQSVSIDSCIELSRAIEALLDRETEDFELTVASAGIGQPLKVFRQYQKLVGKLVEVVLRNGMKIVAVLRDATPETITLAYTEKVVVEGKKKKEIVEVVRGYALAEIKSTIEQLDFK